MIFRKCNKCKKRVWFWHRNGKIILTLNNGKRKILHYCIDCASNILTRSVEEKMVTIEEVSYEKN